MQGHNKFDACERIISVVGPSGSGKTTLITRLILELRAQGLRVSTIKHTHHGVALDRPGKDSDRHRMAGAEEVILSSPSGWVLVHSNRGGPEPELDALLARLDPVDIVLVEGFRSVTRPAIEVWRPALGREPLFPYDRNICAVASDQAVRPAEHGRPDVILLNLDNPIAIARFICARLALCQDVAILR